MRTKYFSVLFCLALAACGAPEPQESDDVSSSEQEVVGQACSPRTSCGANEFCDPKACGKSTGPVYGFCAAVPIGCTLINSPVCGCDGKTYSNDCLRRRARVGLKSPGACPR